LPKLKSIGPIDLNLGDLIYFIIIIKLALDFILNSSAPPWNWKFPTRLKLLVYCLIIIGLMVQIKLLILEDFSLFLFSTVSYARFLSGLLLVFIVPAAITNENRLRTFIMVIVALIVIQACLGFVEFFTGFNIVSGKESEYLYRGRVIGTIGSIGSYSIYLLLGFCLLIAIIVYRLFPPFLILVSLFFILSSLVFTQARAAWLSFLTLLGVMAWKSNIKKRIVILTVLLSCMIGIVFYDTLTTRALEEFKGWKAGEQTSMLIRFKLSQLSVVTGINNLLLGSGWSTFRFIIPKVISTQDRLSRKILSSQSIAGHTADTSRFSVT